MIKAWLRLKYVHGVTCSMNISLQWLLPQQGSPQSAEPAGGQTGVQEVLTPGAVQLQKGGIGRGAEAKQEMAVAGR